MQSDQRGATSPSGQERRAGAPGGGLARAKPRWIDFDAGALLAGAGMDELARSLLDLVIATASGKLTCAERNGEREVAIWKTGVTL
jgi:altronate hydrolase